MKYRVLRVWPSKTFIRRGLVIEDPPWRNVGSLLRTKYIEVVEDPKPEVKEAKPLPTKKEKPNGRPKTDKR